MATNERIRKYLDAGTVLGQVSRGRAEEIVRELVNAGDIQRSQAQEWVDNLVERSQKSSEQIVELVRHEVATQLEKIDPRALEAIAAQVADVLRETAKAGRNATKDVATKAGQTVKDATKKTGQTAKDATNRAGQTVSGVTAQATKTAKDATAQAGQAATRARDAATKVVPTRLGGTKPSESAAPAAPEDSATKKAAS